MSKPDTGEATLLLHPYFEILKEILRAEGPLLFSCVQRQCFLLMDSRLTSSSLNGDSVCLS
jgi:hypothetical protein